MGDIFCRMPLIFIQPSPSLPGIFGFFHMSSTVINFFFPRSGKVFPLMMADKLGDYIVGTAVETIETENLIKEFENVIVDDVYGAETPIDKVTSSLQERLHQKGSKIKTMAVDNVYNETPVTKANTNIWYSANTIADARVHVSPVRICFLLLFACFNSVANY
jgi:hypothetical protein